MSLRHAFGKPGTNTSPPSNQIMPHVIRIDEPGGPNVLQWVEAPVPAPGPGEARLRQTAIGVNFIDVYQRSGLYQVPLPAVMGSEGAGVIEAVGPGVTNVKAGDRVVYQGVAGGYAEVRIVPADRLIHIPKDVDDKTAAAACLKGLTVYCLLRRVFRIEAGQTILFHAAAGGVGQIACQWAKALGATVIGTVGSAGKADLARENGCDHVINYTSENFVERVREITGGVGVDVVYDSVGKDTFPASLDCIRLMGMWVSFGNSSGPVPAFPPLLLLQKGSLFATRPTVNHYLAKRRDLEEAAAELFAVIADGRVKIKVGQTFPLKEAAAAHRALEGRKTVGATILIP
jgi:NADPH:quinone reductase